MVILIKRKRHQKLNRYDSWQFDIEWIKIQLFRRINIFQYSWQNYCLFFSELQVWFNSRILEIVKCWHLGFVFFWTSSLIQFERARIVKCWHLGKLCPFFLNLKFNSTESPRNPSTATNATYHIGQFSLNLLYSLTKTYFFWFSYVSYAYYPYKLYIGNVLFWKD